MPSNASASRSDDVSVRCALVIALGVSVIYLVAMFIAGVVGLIEQIATPAAHIEFNRSVIVATALPLFLFAVLITPELRDDRTRLKVALVAALAGAVICAAATAAIAPGINRTSSFEFAAAAYLLFAACGLLPALAVARGYVFFNRDAQVAAAGDHFIDVATLSAETKRLVAKHTSGTMKPPPAWRPIALFGTDKLSHGDLRRILTIEEEEERRLRDLHESRAASAKNERKDAHHAFILGLSSQEKALFEAKLRADVEAIEGFADYKEGAEREIAKLREHNLRLQTALAEAKTRAAADVESAVASEAAAMRKLARIQQEAANEAAQLTKENETLQARLATSDDSSRALTSALSRIDELNRDIAALKAAAAERTAALAKVAALEGSLAAGARQRDEQGREIARLREAHAKTIILQRSLEASERARAAQERDIDLLKAECVVLSARGTGASEADTTPPLRKSDKPVLVNDRSGGGRGTGRENQPNSSLIHRSPGRDGAPHRRWKRTQYGVQRQEHGDLR